MANAIKPKKVKEEVIPEIQPPIVEETKTGITVPVTEEVVEEIPEPVIQEKEAEEPKEQVSKVYTANEDYVKVKEFAHTQTQDLTMEEKIVQFVDSRDGNEIKLNDFLKSLFGVPKFNEPALWLSQGASKQLRVILGKMNNEGLISIHNNLHMKLGTFYYPDTSTGITAYHNLNTVPIIAKK